MLHYFNNNIIIVYKIVIQNIGSLEFHYCYYQFLYLNNISWNNLLAVTSKQCSLHAHLEGSYSTRKQLSCTFCKIAS